MINGHADFFAEKLALSLWKYDDMAMKYLARMAVEVAEVQSMRIFDASSELITSQGDVQNSEQVTLHRNIFYQGRLVGSLIVAFSPLDAKPIWVRTMLAAGGLLVPVLLLSILVILYILHHYLSLPLKDLLAYIHAVSQGEYGREISLRGGLEMVSIGTSMQNLSRELRMREDRLRKQECELKKSLEKYKTLFDTIPMGIAVSDPQGDILELNPYAENLFGLSRKEFMPRNLADKSWQILCSDGTPAAPENYTAVMALRENRIIANQDERLRGPEGNIFWLNVTAAPIPQEEYGVVVVISDVTERKILEDDLQAYKNMVSFSSDIMFLVDADYRYRMVNDTYAAYRKKEVQDFIGMSIHDDDETSRHDAISEEEVDRCLQGESFRKQKWIEYQDRGKRYMDISCIPYTDNETVRGVVVECRDITEVMQEREEGEKLRKQLMQAQKMESIGTLAGGIAHDFNNILASILGYTELSLHSIEPDSPLKKYLDMVYAAGIRARDLVRQILVFARKGDEELHPLRVDTLTKEVLKLIRSSVPSTIDIKSNIASESKVMGNATQIHQILMNLLTNAYQAMEEDGGTLDLTLGDMRVEGRDAVLRNLPPGDYVRITVSDTGPGIPPEIRDKIFEPYFTTKKTGSGTGMGLALTHGIVKSHGGTIHVTSEEGRGSVFTVLLPAEDRGDEGEMSLLPQPIKTGTERILFVDDETSITSMVGDLLPKLGYRATITNSSIEALKVFSADPDSFDLVISDVTMPGMTGEILAARLLEIRPDIPIILCTGFSSKLLHKTPEELGIRALLNKPVGNADLAAAIRKVLDDNKAVLS